VSLTDRLPDHQDSLTMIRQEGLEGADGAWEFPDFETRWLHDSFLKLVKGIARFASDDPAHGIIVQVQDRLQFARTIRELTIGAYEEQWKDAIAEILLDDRYGFELEPLIGLVPLGTDPESGLWEFWHLESGERPQRDPETGRYRVSDKTGIVLVLIPQGDFIMGAEGTREEWDLAPHLARGYEFPQHRVQLDPFFLSKYEMTVGQWARIDGPNRMRAWTGQSVQQAHPIGTIAWLEADLYVHRFGLRLPTDAQWEYACRAGTQSLFWTGDSLSDLASAENLADRSYGREIANVIFEPWNDGAPFPSLVGSFRPNSFGLFDMAGNIGEWCRDWLVSFSTEPRPGDGERWPSAETPSDRTVRGGTFSKPATDARSSCRWGNAPYATIDYLGVRPSLGIHAVE
jgi:formylglycine-generating enzyme required for sulfatase activity